ncbi:DUF6702 family protein [Crocinitomix algicola]|uniref:DUF6702 family protein n=1 Tax=Crocinitomix algicola TaxID=1740263 RepID=UPI000871DECF|nr:DUF6702 family protein [Crocinitomix algicola]
MIRILSFFTFLLFVNSAWSHKFYVSITDLVYNESKDRIEGSIKLTAHDFEKILSEKFNKKIVLEEVNDSSEIGRYIQYYLYENFKLKSKGIAAAPNYFGKEITLEQDLYIYFTFTNIADPKLVEIKNTVLLYHFPQQQNIVHYRYKELTKTITLVADKVHEKITFDEE